MGFVSGSDGRGGDQGRPAAVMSLLADADEKANEHQRRSYGTVDGQERLTSVLLVQLLLVPLSDAEPDEERSEQQGGDSSNDSSRDGANMRGAPSDVVRRASVLSGRGSSSASS